MLHTGRGASANALSARNLQMSTSSKEGERKCSHACEMVRSITLLEMDILRVSGGQYIIKISTIYNITLLLLLLILGRLSVNTANVLAK